MTVRTFTSLRWVSNRCSIQTYLLNMSLKFIFQYGLNIIQQTEMVVIQMNESMFMCGFENLMRFSVFCDGSDKPNYYINSEKQINKYAYTCT